MQPRKSAARALEQIRAARIQSETPIHDTTASAVKRNNRGSKTASPVKQKEEETSPKKPLLSFKLVNREAKSTHNIQGDEGEEGSDEDSLSPPPSEGDQEEDMDDENSDQSQEDSNEGRRGGTQKRKRRRFDQPSPERSSPYNRRGQTKSPSKSPVKSTEPNVFPSEPLITERDHLVNSSHMAGIILFTTIFRPLLELQKMEPLDLETEIMNPESTFTVQLILKLMSFIRVINRIKPTVENWEIQLRKRARLELESLYDLWPEGERFMSISSLAKAEMIMAICNWIANDHPAFVDLEISPDEMRFYPIGQDVHKNSFWYFDGDRMYIENKEGDFRLLCDRPEGWKSMIAYLEERTDSHSRKLRSILAEFSETVIRRLERNNRPPKAIILDIAQAEESGLIKRSSRIAVKASLAEAEAAAQAVAAKEAREKAIADRIAAQLEHDRKLRERDAERRQMQATYNSEERTLKTLYSDTKKDWDGSWPSECNWNYPLIFKESFFGLPFDNMEYPGSSNELETKLWSRRKTSFKDLAWDRNLRDDALSLESTPLLIYALFSIITTLEKQPEASPFLKPVDYITLDLPTYPTIITRPMDFETARKNLLLRKYENIQQYIEDVCLIFSNCILFNGISSEIAISAIAMETVFTKLICQLLGHKSPDGPLLYDLASRRKTEAKKLQEEEQRRLFSQKSTQHQVENYQPRPTDPRDSASATHRRYPNLQQFTSLKLPSTINRPQVPQTRSAPKYYPDPPPDVLQDSTKGPYENTTKLSASGTPTSANLNGNSLSAISPQHKLQAKSPESSIPDQPQLYLSELYVPKYYSISSSPKMHPNAKPLASPSSVASSHKEHQIYNSSAPRPLPIGVTNGPIPHYTQSQHHKPSSLSSNQYQPTIKGVSTNQYVSSSVLGAPASQLPDQCHTTTKDASTGQYISSSVLNAPASSQARRQSIVVPSNSPMIAQQSRSPQESSSNPVQQATHKPNLSSSLVPPHQRHFPIQSTDTVVRAENPLTSHLQSLIRPQSAPNQPSMNNRSPTHANNVNNPPNEEIHKTGH